MVDPSSRAARLWSVAGLSLALVSTASAQPPAPASAEATPPWNVVLITVDALRADRMSLYGNPRPTTPRLDAFALEAAVFENAFAVSAHTSPGLASLLTGQEPPVHAQTTQYSYYDLEIPSPLRALAARGYDVLGTIVSGPTLRALGFTSGLGDTPPEEFLASRAPADKPFFVWLHTRETHLPYRPAADLAGRFTRDFSLASPLLRAVQEHTFVLRDASVQIPYPQAGPVEPAAGDQAALRALYDETVASADAKVARWIDALREHALLERTLVVVTADHGEELLEHGWVGHASTGYDGKLTDEILHIPLVVRVPGALYAGRYRALASQVDVMPTLFALLGIDGAALAAQQQGVSLLPVLLGERAEVREQIFAETTRKGWTTPREETAARVRALRTRDRKLVIAPSAEGERVEAYDLVADPGETSDRWPSEPARFQDLRARLALVAGRHEASAAALVFAAAERQRAELERAIARGDLDAVVARWRALGNLDETWGLERAPFQRADAHRERWRTLRIEAADLAAAALRCDARGLPLADPSCRDDR